MVCCRRSFDGMFLRYMPGQKMQQVMNEAYVESAAPIKAPDATKMVGYYWATMLVDFIGFVRRCQVCRYHTKFVCQQPEPLHPTTHLSTFVAWHMDIIGRTRYPWSEDTNISSQHSITSQRRGNHSSRYFTSQIVSEFVQIHIMYMLGIPETIRADIA